MDIKEIIILFVFFSYIGYSLEIVSIYIESKLRKVEYTHPKFGPLPLSFPYGFGGVLSYLIITQFSGINIFAFALITLICFSIIEYISAVYCEKYLNYKYWDYSYLRFNLKGRICLRNSLLFMFAGILIFTPLHTMQDIIKDTSSSLIEIAFILSLISIFIEVYFGRQTLRKEQKELID